MNAFAAIVGGLLSIFVYGMLFAAVYKLFTIATDLAEIKELLKSKGGAVDPFLAAHQQALREPREWTVLDKES